MEKKRKKKKGEKEKTAEEEAEEEAEESAAATKIQSRFRSFKAAKHLVDQKSKPPCVHHSHCFTFNVGNIKNFRCSRLKAVL